LIEASFDQGLDKISAEWSSQCSLGIVMAAENYPETPKTGDEISGLDTSLPNGSKVFHAGTKLQEGNIVTAGGRVLCATALGDSVADAQKRAYEAASHITWNGEFHRSDIGWRAIDREKK
ncbi:MAG TPA: phosphoribosylglycinamide synthetase C domain-containing protein, partial [Arenimonas sp.]|nr:phosphoribosylglycinamide synthetase C domain-containing protein [Arenimonas sp.]